MCVRGPVESGRLDRVVLVVAAGLIVAGATAGDGLATDARDLDWFAAGVLALGAVAVVAGGRFPASAALSTLALTYAWYGIGYDSGLVNIVTMAAFYRLGVSDEQRSKVLVAATAVLLTTALMVGVGSESWHDTATAVGYVVMAVLFGELLRNRRLVVEQHAARANRAEADAERRLAQERFAIARDVHDVLAHTVSVMTVQAGVAADAIDRDRDRTAAAIGAIRSEGRRAMDEVRAIVSVLRAPGDLGRTPAAPAPRLARLPELVEAAGTEGLAVDLDVDDAVTGRDLPELVELTAFRVVQESLTNVARHGHDVTRATVRVRLAGEGLSIEVLDDGRRHGSAQPGFGLRGMAERVESIGGTLHHGFVDGGGFTVRACLPTGEELW